MLKRLLGVASLFLILNHQCFAEDHEIAITIDDLPFVGSGTSTPGNLKQPRKDLWP